MEGYAAKGFLVTVPVEDANGSAFANDAHGIRPKSRDSQEETEETEMKNTVLLSVSSVPSCSENS
jgi:hypothetical protein